MSGILDGSADRVDTIEIPVPRESVQRTAPGPGVLRRLRDALAAAWARRETRRVLNSLNDHLLADIGLERYMIFEAAEDMVRLAADEKNNKTRQSVA